MGAGISGASIAFELRNRGIASTVIERDSPAAHASGKAFGGLYPLSGFGIPGPLSHVALRSFAQHLEWAKKLDKTSDFRRRSTLYLAYTLEDVHALTTKLKQLDGIDGFEGIWHSPSEARGLAKGINAAIRGALLISGSADVDSAALTKTLLEEANSRYINDEVIALDVEEQSVQTVQLKSGQVLKCATLVIASGPWMQLARKWLPDVPLVQPLKGEILRIRLPDIDYPFNINVGSNYLGTKGDGLFWAGTTENHSGFDDKTTRSAREAILSQLHKALPDLDTSNIVKHTACLRPMSPDGMPFAARLPTVDNVIVAGGGGRKGVLYAPAIGNTVADQITEAEVDKDLRPLLWRDSLLS